MVMRRFARPRWRPYAISKCRLRPGNKASARLGKGADVVGSAVRACPAGRPRARGLEQYDEERTGSGADDGSHPAGRIDLWPGCRAIRAMARPNHLAVARARINHDLCLLRPSAPLLPNW